MMNATLNSQREIACPALLLPDGSIAHNGLLTFSADGTLINIQTDVQNIDKLANTEYYNGVLIPSMTNAHNHLELSYFQGKIPQGTGLVSFVEHVIAHRQDDPIEVRVAKLCAQDKIMWSQGVGAVGDISNDPFSLDCKAHSQIYYHTFAEYFGIPPIEEAQNYYHKSTDKVINRADELGVTASPSPHSTYLVGDEIFKMAGGSKRASIHFLETPSEKTFFEKKGAMYDFVSQTMEVDFLQYGSHPNRLIESLPSELPLLLVHCTNIQHQDVERIMNHFRQVTFVLCPRSNYYIERLFPPAVMLREMGAKIALGTDSLCSNTTLNLISEVEWLLKNNKELRAAEVLTWATRTGAEALGVDHKLGSFRVGTKCGAVLVEGLSPKTLELMGELSSRRLI